MGTSTILRVATILCVVLGTCTFGSAARAAEAAYTVTDIGSLVGSGEGQFDSLVNVSPVDINAGGLMIANSFPADSTFWSVSFSNTNGKVRRESKESDCSWVQGINDNNEIVGYVTILEDTTFDSTRAVVWRDHKPFRLPGLGGERSEATGNNNAGVIVGNASIDETASSASHAVMWKDDEVQDLETLGGVSSFATDINEAGEVVGYSQVTDRVGAYPVIWESGKPIELATPDGRRGVADRINESGTIVGIVIDDEFNFYPVRWIDGEPEYLATLEEGGHGSANGLNDAGLIVGWSASAGDESSADRAVLWEGDSVVDLNELIPGDSGYDLTSAVAINDSGQIIASAKFASDEFVHGVLLTPVEAAGAGMVADLLSVPEGAQPRQ